MKKHYREENDCLNCGTILEGKYCHNCGQENLQIKESFGHMMNHAISDYFHFDHQFFHTLKPLFFKPGYLTNEYMAGRRTQYLHPVKMYIFVSLIYFLLLFQSGHEFVKIDETPGKPKTTKAIDSLKSAIVKNHNISAAQKKVLIDNIDKNAAKPKNDPADKNFKAGYLTLTGDSTYSQYLATQQKLPVAERDNFFGQIYNKKAFAYKVKYGSRSREVIFDEVRHNVPKMMFVMLPLFALILRITFWRSKKFYVEHLIYAFHLHCFFFLFLSCLLLLQYVIPSTSVIQTINGFGFLYMIWYVYKSLKTVYHRGWFRTITKMIGVYVAYSVVFIFCFCVMFMITALMLA